MFSRCFTGKETSCLQDAEYNAPDEKPTAQQNPGQTESEVSQELHQSVATIPVMTEFEENMIDFSRTSLEDETDSTSKHDEENGNSEETSV